MAAQARANNYMVTAGDGVSSHNSQYGLLQDPNNRPKPKGLAPHMGNDRRGSKSSNNQVAASMDSKMMNHAKLNATGNSTLIQAGRSTVSAGLGAGQTGKGFLMSNYLANNAALGRLPTLGLGKINLDQVQQDDNNKFNVMKDTEKLLVARELDRELKDLKKYEKDNLRIWEKQISTRIDRAGTIRQINNIPASINKDVDKRKTGMQAIQSDADLQNANK